MPKQKTIPELKAEIAANERQLSQLRHKQRQLENRAAYYEKGDRRKRAHRLITRGAAVESVAPLAKVLSETEFYAFAEKAFALPEVKGLLMVGNWHTVKRSKADWIVVDETHEGIVSKEDFQKVQSRMKEYKEFIPSVSKRNPLRRKVICGTCGFAMALSNTKNAKYHCRTSHLETDFDCTSEGILQADIHEMVVTLIRTYAAYAVSLEHLLLLQKERIQAERKQARRELAVLQSRKNQFEKSLQDLYEKLIDGTIDKETYLSQKASNQAQMQELTEKMERLEKSSQTTTEQGGVFIEKYKEYTELDTLTSEIANDVVKRVTVYKGGGIEIELALRDELEKLLTCLETVDAAS